MLTPLLAHDLKYTGPIQSGQAILSRIFRIQSIVPLSALRQYFWDEKNIQNLDCKLKSTPCDKIFQPKISARYIVVDDLGKRRIRISSF